MVFLEAPPTFELFPKRLLGVVKLSCSPADHGSVKEKNTVLRKSSLQSWNYPEELHGKEIEWRL